VLIGDLLQICDSGTHERDQAGNVPLTVGWQPPGLRCRSDGNTPQTALEGDRRPNTHMDAQLPEAGSDRTRRSFEPVRSHGLTVLQHRRGQILARDGQFRAERNVHAGRAPPADHGGGSVRLVAKHARYIRPKNPRHLPGDGGEHHWC
jgi:hypothetical protein